MRADLQLRKSDASCHNHRGVTVSLWHCFPATALGKQGAAQTLLHHTRQLVYKVSSANTASQAEAVHIPVARQNGINDNGGHQHVRCDANLAAVHEREHNDNDGIT